MALNRVVHSILDASNERSKTTFCLPAITNANFNAIVGNVVTQSVGDLRLAVAGITLGNFIRHTVITYSDILPVTPATSPQAQRELRYRFSFQDSVTSRRFSFEVPTPDLSIGLIAGTDIVDPNDADIAVFVEAVQEFTTPDGGTFVLESIRLVGRNQ